MIFLTEMIVPGQVIGIIGGGEIARMLTLAAKSMGFQVGILDPLQGCPASQIADWQMIGDSSDSEALLKMADKCDVLTFEIENENEDMDILTVVEDIVSVPQGSEFLAITQDRLLEKSFLDTMNINIAPYATIVLPTDIEEAITEIGFPCVLKTTQGGYKNKQQYILYNPSDIANSLPLLHTGPCLLESYIPYEQAISVVIAGNKQGEISLFPFSENQYVDAKLEKTIMPARLPDDILEEAKRTARLIAKEINLCGVMGIELFITDIGGIYVNELIPRPHRSGYYSIEACNFSQFEMHIRGICNWPLPEIKVVSPAITLNILGQQLLSTYKQIQHYPSWHFHFYGKLNPKPDRYMGHITILTDEIEPTLEEINNINIWH